MASHTLTTPFRLFLSPAATTDWICTSCRRQHSTFRRTRKALKVKPDPSFLPSKSEASDHIIFNPPSSAPNVYHTPLKFLPKDDPRRKLHTLALSPGSALSSPPATGATGNAGVSAGQASTLPDPVNPRGAYSRYHLKQEQIDEVRRLRKEDPRTWTRMRLAEKFDCSPFFISLCCTAPEIAAEKKAEMQIVKSKWGKKKTEAFEDRIARKKLWGREA